MKRTLLALAISAVLATPFLASGQMTPSTPGTSGRPGAAGSGPGMRMEQEERRGQTDMQAGDVRQVQERLKEAGFNPGPVDGQLGMQTKEALKEYQKAHGLPQTGQLDERTRDILMVQRANGMSEQRQTPGESARERMMPGSSTPGSRSSSDPGAGSTLPGGTGSSR